MSKKFLRPEKREQIESKIKENLKDLKNKNPKSYQLVHLKCGIIVNVEPKKFNSVMHLANYCNQCCIDLKKDEYILNKVQVQRFSKKLNSQLSLLSKTNFIFMYNWILKPTKK